MLTVTIGPPSPPGTGRASALPSAAPGATTPVPAGGRSMPIRKGELYMVVTPDRLAAWGGARYTRRLHPAHAAEPIRVVDGRGETVAVLGQEDAA